jgi:D-alanyl-D-alanine carboxypeptidase/D-alanyl-D-alanine-endopeptidase (penicillin-binding protein 4)
MNSTRRFSIGLMLVLLPVAVAGCVSPQARHDAELAERLDAILARHSDSGAIFTARVVELPTRREVYARNIDQPFTPASNMKIPVSAAGLDMFGLEHTFKTWLVLDGDDLWVVGSGDPGIGDPRLARRRGSTPVGVLDEWADALLARGVERIAGNLYYYDGALDEEWLHPSWGVDVLHWYGAPVSGLNFNDNCVDITIYPTEEGQPVRYEVMPPVQNIQVINDCVTGKDEEPGIIKLAEQDIYKISGCCKEKTELKSKPVGNPGQFFCDALRTHFATRGIEIAGGTLRAPQPPGGELPPPDESIIAVHETGMRDIIGRINTNSQNFFAEALCKLTGQAYAAEHGRHVPGSWADGDRALRAFLGRCGIDDSGLVVADGSGLSDKNKLTARLLTDLFAVMYLRPDGQAFMDSLAKGGVDGSLEERFAGLEGHVFAKTGYIEGVRSLSGYVLTESGNWVIFSIIYNRIPGSVTPYEQLQDEAVKLLIEWPYWQAPPTAEEAPARAPQTSRLPSFPPRPHRAASRPVPSASSAPTPPVVACAPPGALPPTHQEN